MENYQEKIREIIYQESFILYKKCLKVIVNKNNSKNEYIVQIIFNSKLAKELLNKKFIENLSKKIITKININDNNIFKIINSHFSNTSIKNIEGSYKLSKSNNNNIEKLINPIKMQILRKFYNHMELCKLESNIFNFLDINIFTYYHKKHLKTYTNYLGYLFLFIFIFYLIDI